MQAVLPPRIKCSSRPAQDCIKRTHGRPYGRAAHSREQTGPVTDYHWSTEPSAIRLFLFEIVRSRRFLRDCKRFEEVGPFEVILGIGSLL